MLEKAKEKLRNRAVLMILPVEKLNFRGKFDYVFSTEAFHHYANQEKAMKNFYNSLRKKGKLVIVDLDFGFILNKLFHAIEPGNSKMNNVGNFHRLFEEARFIKIKQEKIGLFAIITIGKK